MSQISSPKVLVNLHGLEKLNNLQIKGVHVKLKRKMIAVWLLTILLLLSFTTYAYSWSVGVEWVNKYNGVDGMGNLDNNGYNATGFYDQLGLVGWERKFNWGDNAAWEEDFKKIWVGGTDYIWIDNVNFGYFSGHGDPDSFAFGTHYDDPYLTGRTEAYWGDQYLNWIVIDACEVLKYYGNGRYVWDRWIYPVMYGLHSIMGFDSVSRDVRDRGSYFARYMNGYWGTNQITYAWHYATWATEYGEPATYNMMVGTSVNWPPETWDDHLPGYGWYSSDPINYNYGWYSKNYVY